MVKFEINDLFKIVVNMIGIIIVDIFINNLLAKLSNFIPQFYIVKII